MSFRNDDDFDSESYVKVNVRLMEFWTKYPEGRLETHAEVMPNDVMKIVAKLFSKADSTLPLATGHSFLERFDTEKVGEYTETVAVGRALANAGFRIEKSIASAQEMNRFKERQESRKSEDAPPRRSPPSSAPKEPLPMPEGLSPKAQESLKKELSETPEVPKKLTTSRIFKPLNKGTTT